MGDKKGVPIFENGVKGGNFNCLISTPTLWKLLERSTWRENIDARKRFFDIPAKMLD